MRLLGIGGISDALIEKWALQLLPTKFPSPPEGLEMDLIEPDDSTPACFELGYRNMGTSQDMLQNYGETSGHPALERKIVSLTLTSTQTVGADLDTVEFKNLEWLKVQSETSTGKCKEASMAPTWLILPIEPQSKTRSRARGPSVVLLRTVYLPSTLFSFEQHISSDLPFLGVLEDYLPRTSLI